MNFEDLPCYENAQRLARLEERLLSMDKKLDDIIDHPCSRCQNTEKLARLNTEMRLVKWASGVSFTGLVGGLISWFVK